MSLCLLLPLSTLLVYPIGNASESSKETPDRVRTTPLKEVDAAPLASRGSLAWIEPVHSDDEGNAYLSLVGLRATRHRLAAAYLEASGPNGRWWIAVYSDIATDLASPLAIYGPAPGAPIAHRHEASKDRFTFLNAGQLLTMSSP